MAETKVTANEADIIPYRFSAYRSTAWNTANNAFAKVQFNVEDYDADNDYDNATNYRFTAKQDGVYSFNARIGTIGTPTVLIASIYVNGSEVRRGERLTNTTSSSINADIQLSANDYVEIYLYTASVVSGDTGIDRTFFSGRLITLT